VIPAEAIQAEAHDDIVVNEQPLLKRAKND
jgi:hypothetical protein